MSGKTFIHQYIILLGMASIGFAGLLQWAPSASAFPRTAPQADGGLPQYCREVTRLEGRKARIQEWVAGAGVSSDGLKSQRFEVANNLPGGYLDLGLCWWRSRLQRNAILLAYFEPQKSRPSSKQATEIFRKLSRSNQVVSIPGFGNFLDFTRIYEREMIEVLENWQIRNTISGGLRTANPLRPTFYRETETLFEQVRYVKQQLEEFGSVPFLMLQFAGIPAHSWLVLNVEEITWTKYAEFRPPYRPKARHDVIGYRMYVADPAWGTLFTDIYPQTRSVSEAFSVGDTYRHYNVFKNRRPFPFYVDWMVDLQKAEQAIKTACRRGTDRTLAPDPRSLGYSFEATYR